MIPRPVQMQNQRDYAKQVMSDIPDELEPEIDRTGDTIFITPNQVTGLTPEWERAIVGIFVQLRAKVVADGIPPAKVFGLIEAAIGPHLNAMLQTEHDREAWSSVRGRIL